MNAERMIGRLETGGRLLGDLLAGVSEEDSLVGPAGGGWCIREVLGHLVSEEVEDFRARIDLVLHRPADPWPPLDPEARVRDGGFRERTRDGLLVEFRAERAKSLAWLRDLASPDWARTKHHPRIGEFAAGHLLASWVAHDLLHARQIVRVLHEITMAEGAPFSTAYAGSW